MQKKLLLGEFRKELERLEPKEIFYSSEDQASFSVNSTLRIHIKFSIIIVSINPNLICLKRNCSQDSDFFLFRHVKYIDVISQSDIIGNVYSIVCDGEKHTILVRN